ncbi:MAG: hypothetical protein F4039_01565 [Gammaproteobacteria bacterium]|nr:hypothetical protein [Gammaproteobacteria bacterium]
MNTITKLAHRLMLVAAGILMFAGVPGVEIGKNVLADRESAGYHGPVYDGSSGAACWSEAPATDLLIKHHINHCNWVALAGLIIALAAIVVGIAAFVAGSGGTGLAAGISLALTSAGLSLTLLSAALAIIGITCGISWTNYEIDCAEGNIAPPTQNSGPR